MGFLWKGLLALLWLILVPVASGVPFLLKKKRLRLGECYLAGSLFQLAVMELLTLPMIYFELPLHVLAGVYGGGMAAAAGTGCVMLWKRRRSESCDTVSACCETPGKNYWEKPAASAVGCEMPEKRCESKKGSAVDCAMSGKECGLEKCAADGTSSERRFSWYLAAALLLIAVQICVASLLSHSDADDAFFVGTATTAVQTDTIFSVNPYTGFAYTKLPSRYVLSPFPVFLAVISRLCGSLHPSILAHVIFPAVFLVMAYAVLYRLAWKWFPLDVDARGIFMLLACLLTWFSGFSVYTSGTFQMIRIWQGKALLASALLPAVLWLCLSIVMEKRPQYPWLLLFLANAACCLVSSMGILLSPLMIGVFAVIGAVKTRRLSCIWKCLLCCLPSVMLGAVYLVL